MYSKQSKSRLKKENVSSKSDFFRGKNYTKFDIS